MADDLGSIDDRVRLTLGDEDVLIAESYEVKMGILTQPAAFSMRLGWGDVIRDLIKKYPPGTPFSLSIGNAPQFQGVTDGFDANSDTGATTLVISGRDTLAPLRDATCKANRSFSDITYQQLVADVLTETIGDYELVGGNGSNRKAITGFTAQATQISVDKDENLQKTTSLKKTAKALQVKAGDRWYNFLRRELDRAGLFLWAGADGRFILSLPNAGQSPTYRVRRRRGQSRNDVNVIRARFTNNTAKRFSTCIVHGRGGSAKGSTKSKATYDDAEMIALGFDRPLVIADAHCTTTARAEFHARKMIAESRRDGWHLEYTFAGHTAPTPMGGRAVLAPDTIAHVTDDEFGIDELLYIEDVRHARGPETTTTVTLMRPSDLVFGEDSE